MFSYLINFNCDFSEQSLPYARFVRPAASFCWFDYIEQQVARHNNGQRTFSFRRYDEICPPLS
nr:MAG TPA: hypothetical protein [Caudoviricetes sp.]